MKILKILVLLVLLLPMFSFAQILQPQDCHTVVLYDAAKNYWVRRGFSLFYGDFLELDGGSTPTLLFGLENLISDFRKGPQVQAAYGNDSNPDIVLCPAGEELRCGNKTCVDIYMHPNPTPLYRLTATNFKTGDETTLQLSGYAINPTTFTQKFELNDVVNTQVNQVVISRGGTKLFRLGVVGDEYQDKALNLVFFPMSIYDKKFAIGLDQGKITGELEQGLVSPELQKKIEKINTVESQLDVADIDPEKRGEIQTKLNEVRENVQTASKAEVEAKLETLVNEIGVDTPSGEIGKAKITLTQFVKDIKDEFKDVKEPPYQKLVENPIEGLRAGLKIYPSDASGKRTGAALTGAITSEGTDTLVVPGVEQGKIYAFVVKFVPPYPTDHPEIVAVFRVKEVH